jgi:hypothetical protein
MKGNRQSCIGRRLTTAVLLAAGNVTALFAQPLVSTHPVNLSVFVGQTASFTARANGISPLMVHWEESINGSLFTAVSTPTPISPNTLSTYSIINAQLAQNGNQYQAVFSDSSGSTVTAAATLTVFDYTFTVGQIAVDLTLSGGATPFTPFNDFFNMPNNHPEPEWAGPGRGLLPDGSVNISGRSPVAGENYPDVCTTPMSQLTFSLGNTAPLQSSGMSQPTTAGNNYSGHFELTPSTGQLLDSQGNPASLGIRNNASIPYWVDLRLDLGLNGRKHYYAESFRSDALLPHDAANGSPVDARTLTENVGALRVRVFCPREDSATGLTTLVPLNVKSASIDAKLQSSSPDSIGPCYWALPACAPPYRKLDGTPDPAGPPGSADTVQASVEVTAPGVLDETFLVRANRSYAVTVQFAAGDSSGDVFGLYTSAPTLCVPQGEIVNVNITVDGVFCDEGDGCCSATGRVEMVGADVFVFPCRPASVRIGNGPMNNTRFAAVTQDPPMNTAISPRGTYRLMDVLPSAPVPPQSWPHTPYTPRADLFFETAPINGFVEYLSLFATPRDFNCLGNKTTCAGAMDLDETFVLHPGYVTGEITLEGPDCGAPLSCLQLVTSADELDLCNDPFFWYGAPYLFAVGPGYATASIKGTALSPSLWKGNYEVWLAGEGPTTSSLWNISEIVLRLDNPDYPNDASKRAWLYIDDHLAANALDLPRVANSSGTVVAGTVFSGETYQYDRDYCFSQITLSFRNNTGLQIKEPSVQGIGNYAGLNPRDNALQADYQVFPTFYGIPATYSSGNARINLCLPAGDYALSPKVWLFDPVNSTEAQSTFPPFSMTVACKTCANIDFTPDGHHGPVINLTALLPRCTSEEDYFLQGNVQSESSHTLTDVGYSVNGGAVMSLCPLNPPGGALYNLSSWPIQLVPCLNILTITATDDQGLQSSITLPPIKLDTTPPVLTGCQNVTVPAEAGESGATVSFTVTAMDNCDGSVQPLCHPPSGSFFNTGCTEVTCAATDLCDNQSACAFTVCVLASSRAEGCSLTQGFYGNPKGKFNGTPSLTLLNSLLSPALVVGKLGGRSLSISASSALLLQQRLPAGGPSTTLPNSGDQNLPTAVLALSKGRFANILLGQTITLALNVRLDANLPDFPLPASFCTQGTLPGPDSRRGTSDDTVVSGDFQVFAIPTSVLMSLSDASLGIMNVTVEGLLELANRGLAGLPTGSATLADISAAVDAINRGFDECRALVDCVTHVPVAPSPNDNFGNPIILGNPGAGGLFAAPKVIAEHASVAQIIRTKGFSGAASKEPGEPDIAGNLGGKSIWWRWNALDSGWVSIETAGSSFDTLLAVYVGQSLSNLTLTASSDDTATLVTTEVAFHATAGTNYLIAVDGYDGASGDVTLQLVTGAPRLGPVLLLPGGGLRLGIEGQLGRSYIIESSGDLTTWSTLAVAENSNGFLQFTDPDAGRFDHRFYRVVLEP